MKHFINWKRRYQSLYQRHNKLAVTMTVNLAMKQDQINALENTCQELRKYNNKLVSDYQHDQEAWQQKVDVLNKDNEQGKGLLLANEALQSEVQDLLAKIETLESDLFMREGYEQHIEEANQKLAGQLEYTTNELAEALEKLDTCRDDFVGQIKVTDYWRHLAMSYQLGQELGYTR